MAIYPSVRLELYQQGIICTLLTCHSYYFYPRNQHAGSFTYQVNTQLISHSCHHVEIYIRFHKDLEKFNRFWQRPFPFQNQPTNRSLQNKIQAQNCQLLLPTQNVSPKMDCPQFRPPSLPYIAFLQGHSERSGRRKQVPTCLNDFFQ